MRRCEARIAFQSFEVSRARFTFFTLLVESQTFNVALFRAGGILRIGNRTRGGFEVWIVIDRRICSIPEQYAPIVAFKYQLERLTRGRNVDRRRINLRGIQIHTSGVYLFLTIHQRELNLIEPSICRN
jgi:hypothetical protein